jgi:hypothetical protein
MGVATVVVPPKVTRIVGCRDPCQRSHPLTLNLIALRSLQSLLDSMQSGLEAKRVLGGKPWKMPFVSCNPPIESPDWVTPLALE